MSTAQYGTDVEGLPYEIVGPWVREKHARIEKFVDISRGVRRQFASRHGAGASYVELFSGPGLARIQNTEEFVDGSAIAAWKKAVAIDAPFTDVFVADICQDLATAAETRLKKLNAPVRVEVGPATKTVNSIIRELDPYGLHFVVLDPHGLRDLPFEIIRKFGRLKRPDILIHVSLVAIKRNLAKALRAENPASFLDDFAPGWKVDFPNTSDEVAKRNHVWKHWRKLVLAEGLSTAETAETVSAQQNQSLYWLAFAAKHDRALEFWEKIRNVSGQKQLGLL